MKNSKRSLLLTVALLALIMILSSCSNIYKKGVEYDEYPEKDLPIYDGAIVFEYDYDEDDEECEITYGVTDDVDDVADFYKELFEDEDYTVVDESDDKDEYKCEGYIDDVYFEIEAEEASRDEAKYFECVVTVETQEYKQEKSESADIDSQQSDTDTTQSEETDVSEEQTVEEPQGKTMDDLTELEKSVVGFWIVDTIELGGAALAPEGFAFEFFPDGCYIYNDYFAPMEKPVPWEQTGENEITLGGEKNYLVSFRDGNLVLSTTDYAINENYACMTGDKQSFTANSPDIDPANYFGDENLYNTWVDKGGSGVEMSFAMPAGKDVFGNPMGEFFSEYYGNGEYKFLLEFNGIVVTLGDGSELGFSYQGGTPTIYGVDYTFEIKND